MGAALWEGGLFPPLREVPSSLETSWLHVFLAGCASPILPATHPSGQALCVCLCVLLGRDASVEDL